MRGRAWERAVGSGTHEMLVGLGRSRLTVVDTGARAALVRVPAVADRLVQQLALALRQNQEAIENFAPARHVDRVRGKLLELAGTYGHVVRDGVRIDFPVSHGLLAEMIGSSRETVTRAVAHLQRTGFVDRRGSTYRLLVSSIVLTNVTGNRHLELRRDRCHGA